MRKQKENIVRFAIITRLITILLALMTNVLEDYDRSAPESKFKRWDAVYFLSIAEHGYQHEKQHAFFPGYPGLISLLASTGGRLNEANLIYSGMIVSNFSFIAAALVLYHLGLQLGFRPQTSYKAAIIFCISPCSIFLSSIYTESLFALLSFMGMLEFTRGNRLRSCVWFVASATVRSNGILYAGFFIWDLIKIQRGVFSRLGNLILAALVLAPFVSFQVYGYVQFCTSTHRKSWCDQSIPMLYSFVQKHYWNNGFLNYWTVSQIPLFLLGFPVFFINVLMLKEYAFYNLSRVMSLGTWQHEGMPTKAEFDKPILLPFIYLTVLLLSYLTFFMHVQVILRFFTCLPCAYLYLGSKLNRKDVSYWEYYISYCVLWNLIGTILFGIFLPPA
jgi:GPI mannosyltransferase 2